VAIEQHFKRIPGTSDSIRVIITKDEWHVIIAYTVQFEIAFEVKFYPAIRFDAAHEHPHRDTLDREGRVIDKQWRRPQPPAAEAEHDIRTNWRRYRDEFFERKP
jgi:hypothetical protein